MEINGAGNVNGPEPIRPNRISSSSSSQQVSSTEKPDRAEFSEMARLKALLEKTPDIRVDKIEQIRAEIQAGKYETQEKIQTVIDRLLEEL